MLKQCKKSNNLIWLITFWFFILLQVF
jgi:hypothetical protein